MKLASYEKRDQAATASTLHKLDIFKGLPDSAGSIVKVRSVGSATLAEGSSTIHVHLRTFLGDRFFLLPEQSQYSDANFAILTREDTRIPGRKFFWHRIGDAYRLDGSNAGLLELQFDLLGVRDVYLDLRSLEQVSDQAEEVANG